MTATDKLQKNRPDKSTRQGRKKYEKPVQTVVEDPHVMKPLPIQDRRTHLLIAWALFFVTLIVYMLTQARTMSFWDSGEYATCISILGVPHPPGNPFYILFGRAIVALFGWLAPHAVIAAFISVLTSAFAVLFTYLITVKLTSMFKLEEWKSFFAGAVAALLTAFSFTFWMNAIEAEVYSGLVFFVNLILWLTLWWLEKSEDFDRQNILLVIVYLFFLGFCVHQTALQIAPAVLFIVVYPLFLKGVKKDNFWLKVVGYAVLLLGGYVIFGAIAKSIRVDDFDKWGFALMAIILVYAELNDIFDKRIWFLGILMVLIGLSSHLFLMVRAADRPFINEGHPSTLQMFSDYVLRKQYGETSFLVRRGSFFSDQIGYHFLRYFGMQWFNTDALKAVAKLPAEAINSLSSAVVLILGVVGAWFHNKMNRHSFRYFLSVIILTTVTMVFVMNLSNAEVRDRDYFFVVAYNMWAIWLGVGALAIVHHIKHKAARTAMVVVLLAIPLLNMAGQYKVHDRSNEYIALDYGVNFLNSLEENAIIFTNGDNDTFPLWYAQAVADPHAEEAEVSPGSNIFPTSQSQEAIAEAMAYKNKYLKGIRKDISVANLSLLNTPWYIRQLRDKEGILFNVEDSQLDNLQNMPLYRTLNVSVEGAEPPMQFTIEYGDKPSFRRGEAGYRIADLAVMQIIKDNFGKRPIYFAVTCESYIGFEEYTVNEGMVARVVHTPGSDRINFDRLIRNIDHTYQYRSIDDEGVYKDANMRLLVMNYGSGFVKAALHFAKNAQFDKADEYINKALTYIDDEIKLTEFYVTYYTAKNDLNGLDYFIDNVIMKHPQANAIYASYVLGYLLQNHENYLMQYMDKGMRLFPTDPSYAGMIYSYGLEYNKFDESLAIIRKNQGSVTYDISPYLVAPDSLM